MPTTRNVPVDRDELRGRIVSAAALLLRERGLAAVTTRGVADAAEVQAPTIYRLFGDKDGLLDAVAEYELARYVTAKTTRAHVGHDPVADLRAAWDNHIRFALANPALFAVFADPARNAGSTAATAGQHVLGNHVHRIAAAGRLRVSEQRATDLIHAAGTGAAIALLETAESERDPHLADAMFDAVMQAVLTDAPAGGNDGPVAAAVSLRAALADLRVLSASERNLLRDWLDRIAAPPPA